MKRRYQSHGMFPRGTVDRNWNSYKREKCVAGSKAGRPGPSDSRGEATGFVVCPAVFHLLALVHYFLTVFPFLFKMVMCILCHLFWKYVICFLIWSSN